jgi:1-acyl-sn-glycerol-3-phosphate acyltransferase
MASEARPHLQYALPRPGLVYRLATWGSRGLFQAFLGMHVEGLANVPPAGPAMLLCNHESYLDPLMVGGCVLRPILFGAKEELFEGRRGCWLYPRLNCVPVRRGTADMRLFRSMAARLEAGGLVCLFPEGTRSRDGELRPAQPGSVAIALRAGAPLVPVAVYGTHEVLIQGGGLRLRRIGLAVGRPLTFAPLTASSHAAKAAVTQAGERVMIEIARLKAELAARLDGGPVRV